MTFVLITTGGTIGALAYPDPRNPPKYSSFPKNGIEPVSVQMIKPPLALTGMHFSHAGLEPRDSQDIDQPYRSMIARIIANTRRQNVLVTHGTDSLLKTAEYLHGKFPSKAIVLTGAMTPLANGAASDGFQNLAHSVDHLLGRNGQKPLSPGLHIVLSDYENGPKSKWAPQLYAFTPGAYVKYYDPERGDRSRLMPQVKPWQFELKRPDWTAPPTRGLRQRP